jgi:hypothetical protein
LSLESGKMNKVYFSMQNIITLIDSICCIVSCERLALEGVQ